MQYSSLTESYITLEIYKADTHKVELEGPKAEAAVQAVTSLLFVSEFSSCSRSPNL